MQLRWYQQQAVDACYDYLKNSPGNPCIVQPTGAGKTIILAQLIKDACTRWKSRVILLSHVKELLQQASDKLQRMAPAVEFGVYSAGLGLRQRDYPCTIAGIQSVHFKADQFEPFDLVLIDECHLIPPEGEGMYRRFLADLKIINPTVRVVGLTATPYRMTTGWLCGPGEILNHVCYEVSVRELINEGFLCRLVSKKSDQQIDFTQLHRRGGEFIASESASLMDDAHLIREAVEETFREADGRKSVLYFATSVEHARHVAEEIAKREPAKVITGETPADVRSGTIEEFKTGKLRHLVNCQVLTTGFDAPNIDCVVLLRPTESPGLYSQMVGRGLRVHPGKSDCLVLDFAGNIQRHGPIDKVAVDSNGKKRDGDVPQKFCPICKASIEIWRRECPECGAELEVKEEVKHGTKASVLPPITPDYESTEELADVLDVFYEVHTKRNADESHPKTMRVSYQVGLSEYVSEWICLEHSGFAGDKAKAWWRKRANTSPPESAAEGCDRAGELRIPDSIKLRYKSDSRWPDIVDYVFGRMPGEDEGEAYVGVPDIDLEDVPF